MAENRAAGMGGSSLRCQLSQNGAEVQRRVKRQTHGKWPQQESSRQPKKPLSKPSWEFLNDLIFMSVVTHAKNTEKGWGTAQVSLRATVICGLI